MNTKSAALVLGTVVWTYTILMAIACGGQELQSTHTSDADWGMKPLKELQKDSVSQDGRRIEIVDATPQPGGFVLVGGLPIYKGGFSFRRGRLYVPDGTQIFAEVQLPETKVKSGTANVQIEYIITADKGRVPVIAEKSPKSDLSLGSTDSEWKTCQLPYKAAGKVHSSLLVASPRTREAMQANLVAFLPATTGWSLLAQGRFYLSPPPVELIKIDSGMRAEYTYGQATLEGGNQIQEPVLIFEGLLEFPCSVAANRVSVGAPVVIGHGSRIILYLAKGQSIRLAGVTLDSSAGDQRVTIEVDKDGNVKVEKPGDREKPVDSAHFTNHHTAP